MALTTERLLRFSSENAPCLERPERKRCHSISMVSCKTIPGIENAGEIG